MEEDEGKDDEAVSSGSGAVEGEIEALGQASEAVAEAPTPASMDTTGVTPSLDQVDVAAPDQPVSVDDGSAGSGAESESAMAAAAPREFEISDTSGVATASAIESPTPSSNSRAGEVDSIEAPPVSAAVASDEEVTNADRPPADRANGDGEAHDASLHSPSHASASESENVESIPRFRASLVDALSYSDMFLAPADLGEDISPPRPSPPASPVHQSHSQSTNSSRVLLVRPSPNASLFEMDGEDAETAAARRKTRRARDSPQRRRRKKEEKEEKEES